MIWLLMIGQASPPLILSIDSRPKIEVARGRYEEVKRVSLAAEACGFEKAGIVVPDGFESDAYVALLQAELNTAPGQCLRKWRNSSKSLHVEWRWR